MKQRHRHKRKKVRPESTKLTVEKLEPRVVLSASGFDFGHERFEMHAEELRDHDGNRPVMSDLQRDGHRNERSEIAVRHGELSSAQSKLKDPWRGGGPGDRRPERVFESNHHDTAIAHWSRPIAGSAEPEGESAGSTFEFEESSFVDSTSVNLLFEPRLEPTSSVTVLFTPLAATTSSTFGNKLGSPSTTLTLPPRRPTIGSADQSVSVTSTIPVTLTISSPDTSRPPSTLFLVEPSSDSFEAASLIHNSAAVPAANPSEGIQQENAATFVLLSNSTFERVWHVDDRATEDIGSRSLTPVLEAFRPTNDDGSYAPPTRTTSDRVAQLSADWLWADISEGGFIEIESGTEANSIERFGLTPELNAASNSKRLPTRTPRDIYWFDVGDSRVDLLSDMECIDELAEEHPMGDDGNIDEQAWLLDEGGMILLTIAQFTNHAADPSIDAEDRVPITDHEAFESIEIRMDTAIELFQAIDVATGPAENSGESPVADGSSPSEDEITVDNDETIPALKQAATKADGEGSGSVRPATIPWLVAIAATFSRFRAAARIPEGPNQKRGARK